MHLALAPQHHLVGLRIVHDGDRGILLGELVERLAELHVVLALLGRDRDGEHRRIRRRPWRARGCGLLARGQRVAGLGLVELGEARRSRRPRPGRASRVLWPTSLNTPATRPASSSPDRSVVPSPAWPASMRAIDILPPWVGVLGLEHVGDGVAARFHAEPLRGFGDARRFVAQRLQQPQHAVGAGRGAHQHRAHQAVAQFAGEIVEHLVARRLDVFEQLLHQLVVVVGERLQHREARGLFAIGDVAFERNDFGRSVLLVDKGAFQREIDEAGDEVAGEGRDLPQDQLGARGAGCSSLSTSCTPASALSILLRNRMRGIFWSSSSRRMS